MSFDWLASLSRSISARIEGRNASATIVLAFLAFMAWMLLAKYDTHPALTAVFIACIFIMLSLIITALFFRAPQPSEVSERSILLRRNTFIAQGMQSQEEIVAVLKEVHNVRDLPPPSALVKGSATNPHDYHPLSDAEATAIAKADHQKVSALLNQEANHLLTSPRATLEGAKARGEITAPTPSIETKPPSTGESTSESS